MFCFFGHAWDGCKCTKCYKTRDKQHAWDGCICLKCGKTRDEQHEWDGCICSKCGKDRHELKPGICECEICGEKVPHSLDVEESTVDEVTGQGWDYLSNYTSHEIATYRYSRCRHCGYELDERIVERSFEVRP